MHSFKQVPAEFGRWRVILFLSIWGLAIGVGSMLLLPVRLSVGERVDPLVRAEQLISTGDYAWAVKVLEELPLARMDAWDRVRVRLQSAISQKAVGNHEAALSWLESDLGGYASIAAYVQLWRGECLERSGQTDSAAALYDQVSTTSRGALRDRATMRLAKRKTLDGDYDAAADAYGRLIGGSLDERRALAGMAAAQLAVGDTTKARASQLQLIEEYPWSSEALIVLRSMGTLATDRARFVGGVSYARHGKYRKATRLLRKVVSSFDDSILPGRAQFELGKLYYRKRDYRTASRAFGKAYEKYRVPKGLLEQARAKIRMGRDLEGARQFEAFAAEFPSVSGAAEGLWQAAMAFERRGHPKNARRVFLELANRYPKSDFAGQAMWRAGFIRYKRKEFEGAARDFLRLAQCTDETYLRDQGHFWAGKCYTALSREEEATYWTERAAEGFPASYYSSRARAVLNLSEFSFPDAPEVERPDVSYAPSEEMIRGDLLASLGLYRAAEAEYRQAEPGYVNDRHALNDLLHRYERIGSMDRALRVSNYLLAAERTSGVPITMAAFRRLYPTYYWGDVHRTAEEVDVDPNLLLAIMRQESAFNEQALSSAGARGLMQVMPTTGRQMARKLRLRGFKVEDLWKPNTSIRLGGEHLSDHLRYFSRKDETRQLGLALSAYNAGLGPARRWSTQLPDNDVDTFVESIPYKETRNYVKLVYRNYQVYSYLEDGLATSTVGADPGETPG